MYFAINYPLFYKDLRVGKISFNSLKNLYNKSIIYSFTKQRR